MHLFVCFPPTSYRWEMLAGRQAGARKQRQPAGFDQETSTRYFGSSFSAAELMQ